MKCELCDNDCDNYCTTNLCKECCENMKRNIRYNCKAYPIVLEQIILEFKRKKENKK